MSKLLPTGKSFFRKAYLKPWGVKPGDRLELTESPDGYLLRPKGRDSPRLGTLRDKIPSGYPQFDIRQFRERPYDPAPRD